MKLTTRSQYSIVALTNMRNRFKKGDMSPVTVKEISKEEGLSTHYLEQLFCKMRKAGIVVSVRGPGGGYLFKKPIITYKNILEAVGEPLALRADLTDQSEASCDSIEVLNKAYADICGVFGALTI